MSTCEFSGLTGFSALKWLARRLVSLMSVSVGLLANRYQRAHLTKDSADESVGLTIYNLSR
jgi:hypothetical protein